MITVILCIIGLFALSQVFGKLNEWNTKRTQGETIKPMGKVGTAIVFVCLFILPTLLVIIIHHYTGATVDYYDPTGAPTFGR